ncbi:MAG: PIN domain-containing protein [Dehalococcoidia bacterium]|jgi:predicted nucleic acid-binding protein|nr:PIN domain-containing protein [Dehalococcoidia bacterium]
MWRVVLDSTVLTSALLNPHGSPARLLDLALQGRLRLFATPRMVAAEGRVLRHAALARWHGLDDHEVSLLTKDLPVLFGLVPDVNTGRSRRSGEADLLFCAVRSRADFLVISHPLTVSAQELGGTHIVTADQLVKLAGRDM